MHFDVFYVDIFAIPKRGAAQLRHFAVFYFQIVIVPKRIAQIEKAILALDISALFERALAVRRAVDFHVVYLYVSCSVKRTLFVKSLIFDNTIFVSFGHSFSSALFGI